MSTLLQSEREAFERLLGMASGVILDFSNKRFTLFMRAQVGIEIYTEKYAIHGNSKADRLRAFWDIESDELVAIAMRELLEIWSLDNESDPRTEKTYQKALSAILRLDPREEDKLDDKPIEYIELTDSDLQRLPLPVHFLPVVADRFKEVSRCIASGAYTAAVIMSGSILEAILLGAAMHEPKRFNQTVSAPTDNAGRVLKHQNWSLNDLINSAYDLKLIKLDVKKYAHVLRDFRNFIHPFQQVSTGFQSDEHTANISLLVLNAAIADLIGKRLP